MNFVVPANSADRRKFLEHYIDTALLEHEELSPAILALKTLIVDWLRLAPVKEIDSLHSRIHNALNAQRMQVAQHIERKAEHRNRYLHGSIEYAAVDFEMAHLQYTLNILNALSEGKTVPMS